MQGGNYGGNKPDKKNGIINITEPQGKEAKQWEGYKSHGLKPAYEPIIVAMKPNDKSYANNALTHGVSGLNINACRIGTETLPKQKAGKAFDKEKGFGKIGKSGINNQENVITEQRQGRYPANIILDDYAAQRLDKQSGILKSTNSKRKHEDKNNKIFKYTTVADSQGYTDKGGASRFFKNIPFNSRMVYIPKPSPTEKNLGLSDFSDKDAGAYNFRNPKISGRSENAKSIEKMGGITKKRKNTHPTVKPVKLMEYLCMLTKTPTGGIVYDPYAGSGTTLLGCQNTGRPYIGSETEKDFYEIAQARTEYNKK